MEVLKGDVLSINNEYQSYQDYKAAVDAELQKSAEGFVRIGYLLKVARDTDILKESGYASVNDFAQAEYNLDKSQVSRFIRINDEYSEGGYSDRLQDKYQGYGYAKLALMLLIPAVIHEELSADYSKTEIQALKEEVDEERKISDLEVMMEQKDEKQEKCNVFVKVLHQLGRDIPELYLKLHDAVENTVYDGSNQPVINKLVEALAPAGEAIRTVRIPGVGRKMLSIKGASIPPTVIDIRSNTKESCSWEEFIIDMESLCEDADAKKSWEILYYEPFPVKEEPKKETPKEAPKKEEKKKPAKVTKAKVESKSEQEAAEPTKTEVPAKQEPSTAVTGPEEHEAGSSTEGTASGQTGCIDVSDGDTAEHGSEPVPAEEQLPGQMNLEKDFKEYCPEKEEVAPVQPNTLTYTKEDGTWGIHGYDIAKVPNELYGALCKLRDYELTGLSPEQIKQMDELYLKKCEEVHRLECQLKEAIAAAGVEEEDGEEETT